MLLATCAYIDFPALLSKHIRIRVSDYSEKSIIFKRHVYSARILKRPIKCVRLSSRDIILFKFKEMGFIQQENVLEKCSRLISR